MLSVIAPPLQASSAPANTLKELFAELEKCLSIVTPRETFGSQVTIVFSLRRDGGLLGKPRISFSKLLGDTSEERELTDSIAVGFDRCLPLPITDGLGGAIAGRPIALRIMIGARDTDL